MNLKEFQKHQADFFIELAKRCKVKQEEYGDGHNAFHNFEEAVGLSRHDEPEGVAWEFCVKHLQSVRDIISNVEVGGQVAGHYDQELIDEKFGDIIVYMTLMHGMLTKRLRDEESTSKSKRP